MHIELFGSMQSAQDLTLHSLPGQNAISEWRLNASSLLRDLPEVIAHAAATIACMSSSSETGSNDRSM